MNTNFWCPQFGCSQVPETEQHLNIYIYSIYIKQRKGDKTVYRTACCRNAPWHNLLLWHVTNKAFMHTARWHEMIGFSELKFFSFFSTGTDRSAQSTQTLIMGETLQWSIVGLISRQDLKTFSVPQFPLRALGELHAKLYTKRQPSQQWAIYCVLVMCTPMEWFIHHHHPDHCSSWPVTYKISIFKSF